MGTYPETEILARSFFLLSGVPRKQQKTCIQEPTLCKAFSSPFFKKFYLQSLFDTDGALFRPFKLEVLPS